MPAITRHQSEPSRRDSWPPTQVSLYRSIEADDDNDTKMEDRRESLIDDDPINSFLTPTPLLDDGDTDDDMDMDLDMDMAFDAGIEDPHRPSPVIRSISPSELGRGLRPPQPPRTPTPPRLRPGSRSPPSRNSPEVSTPSSEMSSSEDYDDGEDYVRFTPRGLGLAIPSLGLDGSESHAKARQARKSAAVAAAKAREKEQDRVALAMARGGYTPLAAAEGALDADDIMGLAPSPSIHVARPRMAPAAARGRSTTSFGRPPPPLPLTRPRSWSGASGYGSGRLSPRAWREPSPDVWSIQEDVVGEVLSEMEIGTMESPRRGSQRKGKGKKVRFALPLREDIP